MKLFDYSGKSGQVFLESEVIPKSFQESRELFIFCRTDEVHYLQDVFGFDESTVLNCTDLDESVRYSSFDGYDFVSLVHMELERGELALREINMYISRNYLTLVMPEHGSARLDELEKELLDAAFGLGEKTASLNRIYSLIFHLFLSDISDMLEEIEDNAEAASERIIEQVERGQFAEINRIRKTAYTARKQLRALSYLGEQMLVDANGLIDKKMLRQFNSIDTRLKKLYDFAVSLYDLGGQLLGDYDSKLGMKTNDIVTKLTVLTFFCAPLTVIAGIYGMNFVYMPELKMKYAYPVALLGMAGLCVLLYWILKKKKWL